jgi:hypothetical protein
MNACRLSRAHARFRVQRGWDHLENRSPPIYLVSGKSVKRFPPNVFTAVFSVADEAGYHGLGVAAVATRVLLWEARLLISRTNSFSRASIESSRVATFEERRSSWILKIAG